MKWIELLIIVVSSLFLLTCSEDTGLAPEEEESRSSTFVVGYVTDDATTASALVTMAGGGTVSATGANGVAYSLDFPPYALLADTTVTVTPLLALEIDGPGATVCSACPAGNERCCVTGALFEPAGIRFDSLVTLTIQFPAGEPMPFDDLATVVHFDSAHNYFSVIQTNVDRDARTLTCEISHFSGYGSARPDHAQLYALCENLVARANAAAGNNLPVYYLLQEMIDLRQQCWAVGHAAAAAYLESGIFAAYTLHVQLLAGAASAAPSSATIEALIFCYDNLMPVAKSISVDYVPFDTVLLDAIEQAARAMADEGQDMCERQECDGKNLLAYVLSLVSRDYLHDAALINQVRNWHGECCGEMRVTLTADKSVVNICAVSERGLDNAIANFTVTVENDDGEPIEGAHVRIKWYRSIVDRTGFTDASGRFRASWTGSYLTPRSCTESVTEQFYAEATVHRDRARSEDVAITFRNIRLFTSVNYVYSFFSDEGTPYRCEATIIGNGSAPPGVDGCLSPWSDACDGVLTRSYSARMGDQTSTAVDSLTISACKATGYFEGVLDGRTGETAAVLRSITINNLGWMGEDIVIENCSPGEGCTRTHTDLRLGGAWDALSFPTVGGLTFLNNGGEFDAYIWSESDSGDNWRYSADLQVTVGAGF
jgi:hypothetical protein